MCSFSTILFLFRSRKLSVSARKGQHLLALSLCTRTHFTFVAHVFLAIDAFAPNGSGKASNGDSCASLSKHQIFVS